MAAWAGFLAGLFLALVGSQAWAGAMPEELSVPTATLSNAPQPLKAFAFTPSSRGPHPAVVLLHGCGGLYNNAGKLNARTQMWGEFLAQHGYLALVLDSLSPRNIDELCRQRFAERSLKEADRRGDAYAALHYLRSRSDVAGGHIAVLGWSNGGGVALDTISHPPEQGKGFSAAVAFYPGCSKRAERSERFHPYAPLLLLIGEADDWTPAEPCQQLAQAAAARGEPFEIVTYPDTYHDFDNPALTGKRVRHEVPNGVHPGQGTTIAPNPQARADAMQRTLAFLDHRLQAAAKKDTK